MQQAFIVKPTIARANGFSLIEILLVIGIIAVLALAAFIIYPSVQSSNRAKAESQNMAVMTAGIERMLGARGIMPPSAPPSSTVPGLRPAP